MTPADLIARHKGFTPGPWETAESDIGGKQLLVMQGSPHFHEVAWVAFRYHGDRDHAAESANAALIADAPLMLAALTAQAERIKELEAWERKCAAQVRELESDVTILRRGIHSAYAALDKAANEWIRRFNKRVDDAALAAEGSET